MYATLLYYQRRPLTAMRQDTKHVCVPSSRLLVCAHKISRHLYMLRHIQEFSFSSSQNFVGAYKLEKAGYFSAKALANCEIGSLLIGCTLQSTGPLMHAWLSSTKIAALELSMLL